MRPYQDAPRTLDQLFEVVVREIKERDEEGTFRFFATSRRGAQRLCVAFMKAFPWIELIEIAYLGETHDQYMRRTPEHPPGTADWWHVDLRNLKDPPPSPTHKESWT